ncbi:hypothetical protein MPSI1_000211 [Malassezia psittaci]|uniref:Uncharacterized protein n=1 Tax=Malassezia psittaci TaxID=1821823 RepID=A0AAF0JCP1_9BASI|nr:hypothetical protein MPSI1_000211 [Malassezia psittaci]
MQIKVSLLFVLGALSVALVNASPSSAEAKEVKAEKAEGKYIPAYIWDGLYHEKRAEEGINPGLTDGLYHDKRDETKQKEGKYIPAYIWDGLYTETRHGETGKVVDGKWIPSYIWSGLYHEKRGEAKKAEGKWIPSYIWSGLYTEKSSEKSSSNGMKRKRAEEGINPGLTDGLYHDKRDETKQKEGKYIPAYIWDGLYTETRHGETGKVVDGKWIPSYIWSGLYHEKRGEAKKAEGKWIPSYIWSGLYHEKRAEEGINPGLTDGLYHEKRAEEDGVSIPPSIRKILAKGN